MSNKTDLQENNVKLQTIKNNVEELPESNAWKGQTSIVPGTQAITIPAYTDTALTVQGDSNFTAENIKSGVELWGIIGTYQQSIQSLGIDIGTVTKSSVGNISINHSLGVIPNLVLLIPYTYLDEYDDQTVLIAYYKNHILYQGSGGSFNYGTCRGLEISRSTSWSGGLIDDDDGYYTPAVTATKITFKGISGFIGTFKWIAITNIENY